MGLEFNVDLMPSLVQFSFEWRQFFNSQVNIKRLFSRKWSPEPAYLIESINKFSKKAVREYFYYKALLGLPAELFI